jgi:serine/threonine protein phosphatase PrpC
MKYGIASVDGRGRPSEDRNFVRELPGEMMVAGVFDGHSGLSTVDFTLKMLPDVLVSAIGKIGPNDAQNSAIIRPIFIEHDKKLARQVALHYRDSGSTATVAFVTATHCIIAFAGDSPAFIIDPDTGKIITAIHKHEPTVPEEYRRIVANGGEVTNEDGDTSRVNGCLAVSRAFGDFSLKFKNSRVPEWDVDWATKFCVTADPDIVTIPRPAKGVLAIFSDGLVETADGEGLKPLADVAALIHASIREKRGLKEAADDVLRKHIAESVSDPADYSGDDLTLVLVDIGVGVPKAVALPQKKVRAKTRKAPKQTGNGTKKLLKTIYI